MTDDKDIKKNVMKGFDMVFRHLPFVLRQPMEGCPSRDTAFALNAGPAEGAKEVQCPNLRACYQFFEYVRRNVPDEHRHIIDDGRECCGGNSRSRSPGTARDEPGVVGCG